MNDVWFILVSERLQSGLVRFGALPIPLMGNRYRLFTEWPFMGLMLRYIALLVSIFWFAIAYSMLMSFCMLLGEKSWYLVHLLSLWYSFLVFTGFLDREWRHSLTMQWFWHSSLLLRTLSLYCQIYWWHQQVMLLLLKKNIRSIDLVGFVSPYSLFIFKPNIPKMTFPSTGRRIF